ncbi:hypothetical protein TWF481_001603 [Arthrobotrys musiformis]|uniref:Uncharacterized protein n=1 Tax=Arthrobotrys musiformis TaxID=47236 RepID=A0AAV9VVR8_9PEZI
MWSWMDRLLGRPPLSHDNGPPCTKQGVITLNGASWKSRDSPRFVFIHDLSEDRDRPWHFKDSGEFWPSKILREEFPEAEISIYGYDTSNFTSMGTILDPDILTKHANIFMEDFPILVHEHRQAKQPLIIFAHGYGGLIYERAAVLSYDRERDLDTFGGEFYLRPHLAFLFNTPHFAAGLAEWAVISATALGLIGGETARSVEWRPYNKKLGSLVDIQEKFRRFYYQNSEGPIRAAGCFARIPISNTRLVLSPVWAYLPTFIPIAIDQNHFDMTRFQYSDEKTSTILETLEEWLFEIECCGWLDTPFLGNPSVEGFRARGDSALGGSKGGFSSSSFEDDHLELLTQTQPSRRPWGRIRTLSMGETLAAEPRIAVGSIIIESTHDPNQIAVIADIDNILDQLPTRAIKQSEGTEDYDQVSPTYKKLWYEFIRCNYVPEILNTQRTEASRCPCRYPGRMFRKGGPLSDFVKFDSITTKGIEFTEEFFGAARSVFESYFFGSRGWIYPEGPNRPDWIDWGGYIYLISGVKTINGARNPSSSEPESIVIEYRMQPIPGMRTIGRDFGQQTKKLFS